MNEPRISETSVIGRLWNTITKGWVTEVPEDISCCEFNCRESHCEQRRWESCEHRLRYMAIAQEHCNKNAEQQSTTGAQGQNPK
jgi:hypothetical protein